MNRNIHEVLGRFLSIRARSEGEVMDYLKRKAVQYDLDEASQEQLISKYKSMGIINDSLYVESLTHATLSKGKGQAFIRTKLRLAHVDPELITQALASPSSEDLIQAMEKRLRRYEKKWESLDPKMRRQKAYTALFSSGFSTKDIRGFVDVWTQKVYNDPKV